MYARHVACLRCCRFRAIDAVQSAGRFRLRLPVRRSGRGHYRLDRCTHVVLIVTDDILQI